jgi:hypothetical protein
LKVDAQVIFTGSLADISALMASLGPNVKATVSTTVGAVEGKKRGRPTKEEAAARRAAAELQQDDDDLGLGAAEDEPETEESEDEEGEEAEDSEGEAEAQEEEEEPAARKGASVVKGSGGKGKALTLEADIIPAFQKFAKDHSREKAAKVLAKFKAKNVKELAPKHYADVLKLLKKG